MFFLKCDSGLSGNSVQEPEQKQIQKRRSMDSILKRRGIIRFSNNLFEPESFSDEEYVIFCKIFSVFIPLHIESDVFNNITKYYGYCKFFDAINDNELPPEYKVIIKKEEGSGEFNISFKKNI